MNKSNRNLFTSDCVTVTIFSSQYIENSPCVYFSQRVVFQLPKLDFLYVTPIYLLFQISMYQDTIFATKVALFQVFTKVLKIPIFGLSKWSVKVHLFAIFLGFCVVYWIPRLHAKDKFHTFNLLSLRVFWIRTNFGQNFMAAGTRKRHFTFCRFSQK